MSQQNGTDCDQNQTTVKIQEDNIPEMKEVFDKLIFQIKSKMDSNQLFAIIQIPDYQNKFLNQQNPQNPYERVQIISKQTQDILYYLQKYGYCEIEQEYLKRNDLKFYLSLTEYASSNCIKVQEDRCKLEREIKSQIQQECYIYYGSSKRAATFLLEKGQAQISMIGFSQIYDSIGNLEINQLPEIGKMRQKQLNSMKIQTIDQFRKSAFEMFLIGHEEKRFFKILSAAYGIDHFECQEQIQLEKLKKKSEKQQKKSKKNQEQVSLEKQQKITEKQQKKIEKLQKKSKKNLLQVSLEKLKKRAEKLYEEIEKQQKETEKLNDHFECQEQIQFEQLKKSNKSVEEQQMEVTIIEEEKVQLMNKARNEQILRDCEELLKEGNFQEENKKSFT